jgi:hypothetical protein
MWVRRGRWYVEACCVCLRLIVCEMGSMLGLDMCLCSSTGLVFGQYDNLVRGLYG